MGYIIVVRTEPYRPVRPENQRTRSLTGTVWLLYRIRNRTGQNRSKSAVISLNR
ncbi:unnamed protein product [Lupinus luteus]|uniref:Uncharacterized protein n=1 Tax=Lupinus luteus TaxID=3873 RepID=A0AAV1XUQ6_LUPLU